MRGSKGILKTFKNLKIVRLWSKYKYINNYIDKGTKHSILAKVIKLVVKNKNQNLHY